MVLDLHILISQIKKLFEIKKIIITALTSDTFSCNIENASNFQDSRLQITVEYSYYILLYYS